VFDLFLTSMSAKYTLLAPILVPMFMMVGVSPELTQCAYRIGDSVANPISPLNPYLIVVLAVARRWAPASGIGTLFSTMLPYSIAFSCAWVVLLLAWIWCGAELGPEGPLTYAPSAS
jgi:aminobenzoyl-glutamate transport protein